MKKRLLILLAFIFVISYGVFAEDPMMQADPGMPGDPMASDPGADPGAGMPGGDIAGADLMPADPAMGADPGAGMPGDEAGTADPSMGADPGAEMPGDNAALPGDPGAEMGADMMGADMGAGTDPGVMSADPGNDIAGSAGMADPGLDPGVAEHGDFASQGNLDSSNQQVTPDNSGIPGDENMTGMEIGISENTGVQQQAVPQMGGGTRPAASSSNSAKKSIPYYKAIPMTNELRVMDKKSGELGQQYSLKRFMSWMVECSSQMKAKHGPMNTQDMNAYTAWVTNKGESGMGQTLTLDFSPIYFASMQEGEIGAAKITGIKIINGYNKSKEDWTNNSRVRTMRIYKNDRVFCNIELYDITNWQEVKFKKAMIVKPGDVMKAKITDYYEGYKYPNAAITEFLPVGAPDGVVVGSQYMDGKPMTSVRNGGMYD